MYSFLMVMLAILCSQSISAQESNILLEESFATGKGDFVVEGEKGINNDVWTFRDDHIEATTYMKYSSSGNAESYFVSKEFTLGLSDNYVSFDHAGLFFYPDMEGRISMVIRNAGSNSWEEIPGLKHPADAKSGIYESSGEMAIPEAYNGARVQIAFKFFSKTSYNDGVWQIKNLVVKTNGEMPEMKKETELSFDKTDVVYALESGEFVAPVLNNPNNLAVTYSSQNEDVATVDANTGIVTIVNPGSTIIQASSEENAEYYSGSAKYSLLVKKPYSGISFDKTEVNYEIGCGEKFVEPTFNNPNNVQVSFGTSDYNVATVEYQTGKIKIVGMGTAVIKAISYETDMYSYTEATYTINVTDPSIVFQASFSSGLENFTEEGDGANIGLWSWSYGSAQASGYNKVDKLTEVYLVSPEFTLYEGSNSVTFNMSGYSFQNIEEEAQLVIREVNGEWTNIPIKNYPEPNSYNIINAGKMIIPEQFNGKKVQLAFKYITDGVNKIGYWSVNHLIVKKEIKKENAGISFDVTEVNAEVGKAFEAPVLNNPNNLNISYKSSNPSVAYVDEATGKVSILNIGTTKITATSLENKDFYEGKAEYTITVTDPNIIFSEDFSNGISNFTEEGVTGIWEWTYGGYAKADGYGKVKEMSESYLVSPEMSLDANGNLVGFTEMASYFNAQIEQFAQLLIREVGSNTWEVIEGLNRPVNDTYEAVNTGDATIPEKFNGKKVQLAFKYVTDGGMNAGIWYVTKLIVKRTVPKVDPEIAFTESVVEYDINSADPFVAPELINPNNVPVKYSSGNMSVAYVEQYTGNITIIGEGEAVITVTSEETDEFNSATASYTIIVTSVPTGIEGITADDLINGKVYDLQGRRVDKLGKGIYIVNGKKVIIK